VTRRTRIRWCLAAATVAAGLVPLTPASAATPVAQPASLVDPFAGTGTGSVNPGSIGEFPGADVPFGMVQWSPDTTPHRIPGSGYSFDDARISGFSLTHLSGDGCPVYGDVPILPTVGAIGPHPGAASARFTHAGERASPGSYQVVLGPSGISARLAVTARTGISRFRFPRTRAANVVFKVSGSAAGVSATSVRTVGHDEVVGAVTSGQFCQTGTNYTLYFVARFDRPFTTSGTWLGPTVDPGGRACTGTACGAWVTFDALADPTVAMKLGVSFVSEAGAAANLAAEDPGWSLDRVEQAATASWNALLGRIRVGGGTPAEKRTFYTALYHSLLHPNVVSDDDGQYPGADGRVHRATDGAEYANFSEWDIYRSEIQLISLLAPARAGSMVQSLLDHAQQTAWLPKWEIVAGDASQMSGDSADPIIASAYAFGARGFDVDAALQAMVKGASEEEPPQGLEIERQYLTQYLTQHYVDAGSRDLDSIDYSIGGSVTLEYALDDFSIAQIALTRGNVTLAADMMARAHNWEYEFNPATGYIQARQSGGSFPPGPAFNPTLFEAGGQQGFEEGNAIQYTWSVPQDLAGLAGLMGGDAAAESKLNTFFTELNATRFRPYDWAGNEPSLWTPWEYDYLDAPWRTQEVVRRIATTLYADAPVNEPGNDDLGAISSWYVWAAMGLYPVTPGTANLALASPLFTRVVVTLADGHRLVLVAPGASASTPYVHRVTARTAAGSGRTWARPWLPASVLDGGGTFTFALSSAPDRTWGASPGDRPPSFAQGRIPVVGFTRPSGAATVHVGAPTTISLGAAAIGAGQPPVQWRATVSGPLTVAATSGTLAPGATTPLTIAATGPGQGTLDVTLTAADGETLPPVVVAVSASS